LDHEDYENTYAKYEKKIYRSGSFSSFTNKVTIKSRVIASVMGQITPDNLRINSFVWSY